MKLRPTVLFLLGALVACSDAPATPKRFTVYVAASAPEAVRIAADDVRLYLERMGRTATLETRDGAAPGCASGRGNVVFLGDGLGEVELGEQPTDQTHRIQVTGCDDNGKLVLLSGGGLLGRQYAAYEWLHSVGVRFFHPEEEFVPTAPFAIEAPQDRTITPAFRFRSVSLHLTHPLELGDPFRLNDARYFDEAVRFVDWQIKNRASFGSDFQGRGFMRGFPRSSGIRIWGGQQGDTVVVDPEDPRPDVEQVQEAIDAIMSAPHDVPVTFFNVNFTPTEYTEMPDEEAVAMLEFIATYFAENYPDVRVHAGNQGTHGEATENYGVRYGNLSQFAPPNLGVTVHPLMFYDLFRPAPVYGNESFNYLFDFMEQEHQIRPLWYFPESAWWLTFDIAVPLYLPVTIEARDRDIQGLKHMLAGKLDGHRVFGSGHEWGFWQNEYCSFRMAAELDYRWTDCLADLVAPMDKAGDVTRTVLEEAIALQERDMFDAELIAFLVGTDQETELGASVGIHHHPLPPPPALIMTYDAAQVAHHETAIEPRLQLIEEDYRALVARLSEVEGQVPDGAANFFAEIRDGLEMFEIRAAHQWRAYGAAVRLRRSQLEGSAAVAAEAELLLDDAREITERARQVVHRREAGYRYAPIERSIAGGPRGGEDQNWTTYPYRYLNRTHHVFFYESIDERVMAAFRGVSPIEIEDALVGPGEPMRVWVLEASLVDVTVDFGDGTVVSSVVQVAEHEYASTGAYTVTATGDLSGNAYALEAPVASLESIVRTGFSGVILEPAGASIIEPVMPGLVFGPLGDGRIAIGFSHTLSNRVSPSHWSPAELASSDPVLSEPLATVEIPVVIRSSETVVAHVVVHDLVLSVEAGGEGASVLGQMDTESVVRAAVEASGGTFTEAQARTIVATTLGYSVSTLPETVPFEVRYLLP
jgi:hypothetical protein